MIAPELVHSLQRLNREEKLQVIQYLKEDLSDDVDGFPKGLRVFKPWPTRYRASDGGAAMRRVLDEDQTQNDRKI